MGRLAPEARVAALGIPNPWARKRTEAIGAIPVAGRNSSITRMTTYSICLPTFWRIKAGSEMMAQPHNENMMIARSVNDWNPFDLDAAPPPTKAQVLYW
jgi:hypothetical protein